MERLKRDAWILKPQLIIILKKFVFTNIMLALVFAFLIHSSTGNEILSPKFMATTLLIAANGGIISGLILKYCTEWRKVIQDEFDRLDAEEKYPFFTNRFNK
jgi:ATP/ADP translocase